MEQPADTTGDSTTAAGAADASLLGRYPWLVFVAPFVVYMLANSLEPAPPKGDAGEEATTGLLNLSYDQYPLVYCGKIVVTLVVIALLWRGYRAFPLRVSMWGLGVGALGGVLWIALCQPPVQEAMRDLWTSVGMGSFVDTGLRSGFDPLTEMADTPVWAYAFLAVRFAGLVVVVPWIEEFFWRGFLVRFLAGVNWETIPFGSYHLGPLVITTVAFALAHPLTEFPAAVTWFALVSWVMISTRNIYDCIVAHAVTNLMVGIYVVATSAWYLM